MDETGAEAEYDLHETYPIRSNEPAGASKQRASPSKELNTARSSLKPASNGAANSTHSKQTPNHSKPYSTSSRANHTPSQSQFLAPPFYNRPPTPLPPSPSFTSLLRPSRSQSPLPSRPTTPDSSDPEFSASTHKASASASTSTTAAITSSALAAPSSFPRTSPRVPTHEYYGFVLYITSTLVFLMYLFWSFLPSRLLHALGLTYYPDRWWSLAIPAWLVMLVVYIYVALASYNTGYLTLKVGDLGCMVDEAGVIATVDQAQKLLEKQRSSQKQAAEDDELATATKLEAAETSDDVDWKSLWNIGTDGVIDIPIGGVCEVLYGDAED